MNTRSHIISSATNHATERILQGDSGSLVVDALTNHPYGYVISVNHFKELHIMPLKSVLGQISDALSLPNLHLQVFTRMTPRPRGINSQVDKKKERSLTRNLFQYWPVKEMSPPWFEQRAVEDDASSVEDSPPSSISFIQSNTVEEVVASRYTPSFGG